MTILIDDWGRDEYLDGNMARYCICKDSILGETLAFCFTKEDAFKIAHAFAAEGEDVIIEGPGRDKP
jgi:hypothetical protein